MKVYRYSYNRKMDGKYYDGFVDAENLEEARRKIETVKGVAYVPGSLKVEEAQTYPAPRHLNVIHALWCYFDQVEREPVCGVYRCGGTMADAKREIDLMTRDRAYPGTLMIKYISSMAVEEEYFEEG